MSYEGQYCVLTLRLTNHFPKGCDSGRRLDLFLLNSKKEAESLYETIASFKKGRYDRVPVFIGGRNDEWDFRKWKIGSATLVKVVKEVRA